MKKFATTFMALALFMLTILGASALQITDVTIGDDDQDRIKDVSNTISVTNNDTVNSVAVTLSYAAATGVIATDYNVRFDTPTFTLSPSENKAITVTVDIPLDHDAVDSKLKETALSIGKIQGTIDSATTPAVEASISVQAANQLQIDDARIECDDKSEGLDDGDDVKNLKPDMDCTIEITVENRFDEDDDEDENGNDLKIGDIEFDKVDVEIDIDDNDFDESDSDDADDLSADDKDEVNLEFEIDEDVKDGTYDLVITVEGTDENKAKHGEVWNIDLEVDRLTHDLQIRAASISPTRMSSCEATSVRVTARISNFGKRDEDEGAVELNIPELKFSKRVDQIELDEDDSTSVNILAEVPEGTRAGIYRAILSTFFDNSAPSNSEALEFTVDKCEDEEVVITTEDMTQSGTVGTTTQTGTQTNTAATSSGSVAVPRPRTRSSDGFTDSPAYLWVLGGVAVVMLIIIIALLMVAFRKPRQDVL